MKSQGYYDAVATSDRAAGRRPAGHGRGDDHRHPRRALRFRQSITIAGAPPEPTTIARRRAAAQGRRAPGGDRRHRRRGQCRADPAAARLSLRQDRRPRHRARRRRPTAPTTPCRSTAGPRSVFGTLQTKGDQGLQAQASERLPALRVACELYDSRWTEDLRQALVGTSLFSSVAVEPIDTQRQGCARATRSSI